MGKSIEDVKALYKIINSLIAVYSWIFTQSLLLAIFVYAFP